MHPAHASAPGKIILFGEHAVVHGQPAIAVPLTAVQVAVSARPTPPGSGITVHVPAGDHTLHLNALDNLDSANSAHNALLYPLVVALRALQQPVPDLTFTVESTIPIASGLGSGAALAAALIRALGAALDRPFDNPTLNPLVFEVEKRHHGLPSGIDNTVIVYAQPVFFVRDHPIQTFSIAHPFTVIVADSGKSSPTRFTVGDVRQLYQANPVHIGGIFTRIGDIAQAARTAIESGTIEVLGSLMDENHRLLQQLTVSSGELDRLCDAARQAGARGAKLSGGGRGGNVIALVEPATAAPVTAALRAAGAVNVIQTTVQQNT
jgi:mevalonate kinase